MKKEAMYYKSLYFYYANIPYLNGSIDLFLLICHFVYSQQCQRFIDHLVYDLNQIDKKDEKQYFCKYSILPFSENNKC
jgi:hypothetical protein